MLNTDSAPSRKLTLRRFHLRRAILLLLLLHSFKAELLRGNQFFKVFLAFADCEVRTGNKREG